MLALVTQYCEGNTLYENLQDLSVKMDLRRQTQIAKSVANGMYYLHEDKDIIHRDLKSLNIFLDGNTPKIGDFGLATMKNKWKPGAPPGSTPASNLHNGNGVLMGSILWMAPEIMKQKYDDTGNPYTKRSDVYAFGVVLYEIFTRELPFVGNKNAQANKMMLLWQIGSGKLQLSNQGKDVLTSNKTPTNVMDLIFDCAKYNRDERLTFKEIVSKLEVINKGLPSLARANSF